MLYLPNFDDINALGLEVNQIFLYIKILLDDTSYNLNFWQFQNFYSDTIEVADVAP